MKKRFFCLAAVLCLLFALGMPAFAADDGYVIRSYDVAATLHENNTVSQTETITAEFLVPSRGIFRVFPEVVYVEQETEKGLVTMPYRVDIDDIAVTGGPYEAYTEDGYFYIRIGDEDTYLTGTQNYTISFTYDVGDDRVDAYDALFYSVNGPDWSTTIENFTFSVAFDKPLPADSVNNFTLSSGAYGTVGNDAGIEYTVDANGVSGSSTAPLPPQTGVTLYTRLPEGYFTDERTVSVVPAYILFVLAGAAVCFTLLKSLGTAHKRPVQTVEFYPPAGVSSAEVGYFVDGSADAKDLISLIIWFASQGYLTIESIAQKKKEEVVLHKVKPLPADAPEYQKLFFNALFGDNGDTRRLDDIGSDFYNKYERARASLGSYFTGERALYHSGSRVAASLLPLLCVGLFSLACIAAGCFISEDSFIFPVLAAGLLVPAMLMMIAATSRWTFCPGWQKALFVCGIAGCGLLSLGALALGLDAMLVPAWVPMAGFAAAFISILAAGRIPRATDYRIENAGKLLGLRSFIEKAELPRIKMLAEENPSYFYDVLPYAYVFGLSDIWAKQFESLAVPPPSWYYGSMDVWDVLWFDRMMTRSLAHSMEQLHPESSDSGGHGGASFGGGGGFSGGGFGGGGGGRW